MKNLEQKKEKLGYALKNNIYLLKLAYRACKGRVIWEFVNRSASYFSWILVSVILLEAVLDNLADQGDVRFLFGMIGASVLLLWICDAIQLYCYKIAFSAGNQKLYENLHVKMFEKALEVELECYENPEFYNRYTKAASQIKGKAFSVINLVPDLAVSMVSMLFLVWKTMAIDVFAILFALVPIFSTYFLGKLINRLKYGLYQDNVVWERQKNYVQRTVYLQDYAKEIRLSNIFEVLMRYFHDAIEEMIVNVKKYGWRVEIYAGIQGFCTQIVIFVGSIVYATLRLLYFKDISTGEFVVLVNAINNLTTMISQFVHNMSKLQDNSLYIDNVREFLEYEPKIAQSQDGLIPDKENICLDVNDVSYTYFGQNEPVLKHIHMEIKKGEKIALVGHNGAGKSTLVKLLMRLYDPQEGQICLNGTNISEYNLGKYRDLFAAVFQDFKLFSVSVAENVLMGEVSEEERPRVEQALKDSGVYEKIQALKKGMDTTLTKEFDPDGTVLSGGQGQMVAIARVFARDSSIAILDEPSSALDPIAEYKMYETMLKACEDKAVVFISHRLSSAVLADKIYMLEQGRVIETGSHEELMKKNGKYAQMFAMQAKNYA